MNVILDMPYSFIQLTGEPMAALNKLKKTLTADVVKFDTSGHHGKTKICLLEDNKEMGGYKFRTGLWYRVQQSAPILGMGIESIQDRREKVWPTKPLSGMNENISLRPYQDELVTKILQNDMGVLCAATGAGKTRMAAAMISRTKARTLFLVNTKDLLEQAQISLQELLGVKVGTIGDGTWDLQPVTVGTVQTLVRRPDLLDFDMVIVDETHHLPADTFYAVTSRFKARRVYGLSATPYRSDKADLLIEAGAGPISARIGPSELVKNGVLVRPMIRFIMVQQQMSVSSAPTWIVYDHHIVKNGERNAMIAKAAKDQVDQGSTVVIYVRHIKHASLISGFLLTMNVKHVILDGKDKSETRTRVLDQLRKREINLVISTLLKEGVDVPSLNCIVNAAGGMDTMQLVGRVLRKVEGKEVACVIDFIDNQHVSLQRQSWARVRRLKEEPEFQVIVA